MDGWYCSGHDRQLQEENFRKFKKNYNVYKKATFRNVFPCVDSDRYIERLFDHTECFLSYGYRIITSQPYITIDMIEESLKRQNMLTEFIKICNIDIDVCDSSHSWYMPNEASLIVFKMDIDRTQFYKTALSFELRKYYCGLRFTGPNGELEDMWEKKRRDFEKKVKAARII